MTTAFSVLGSILCFVVAFWVKESGTAMGGLIALGIAMACNLSLIIGLFRWMSAPAKEIAKRRKKTVLRMLGTEPQSEA